jgi:hypothetical protein
MDNLCPDEITVKIKPTLNMLGDIVTTAVEGGIGYWAKMTEYRWMDLPFPVAKLVETDNDGNPLEEVHEITPEVVRKGLQLVLTPGLCHPEGNTYKSVYAALTQDDSGSIDSDAADNVIQFGLFGKLVYS